jgi:hypothetical protein
MLEHRQAEEAAQVERRSALTSPAANGYAEGVTNAVLQPTLCLENPAAIERMNAAPGPSFSGSFLRHKPARLRNAKEPAARQKPNPHQLRPWGSAYDTTCIPVH